VGALSKRGGEAPVTGFRLRLEDLWEHLRMQGFTLLNAVRVQGQSITVTQY
jgi:hypothetical protein